MNFVRHESYSDANFYLRGSFIKCGDRIGRVTEVDSDGIAYVDIGGNMKTFPYESLDLSPLELGYVYSPKNDRTYFIERMPSRQWRQGLTSDNTTDRLGSYLEFNTRMDYMNRIVKGRFPHVNRALRLARKTGKSIPFSRDYVISDNGYVFFKTIRVGSFDKKTMKFSLLDNYFFLERELEEYVDVYKRLL